MFTTMGDRTCKYKERRGRRHSMVIYSPSKKSDNCKSSRTPTPNSRRVRRRAGRNEPCPRSMPRKTPALPPSRVGTCRRRRSSLIFNYERGLIVVDPSVSSQSGISSVGLPAPPRKNERTKIHSREGGGGWGRPLAANVKNPTAAATTSAAAVGAPRPSPPRRRCTTRGENRDRSAPPAVVAASSSSSSSLLLPLPGRGGRCVEQRTVLRTIQPRGRGAFFVIRPRLPPDDDDVDVAGSSSNVVVAASSPPSSCASSS
jgi:hypothetical protein